MRRQLILLVEDNPADVGLICEAIEREGIQARILVLDDGDKAVRHLELLPENPALIVLDLNLPKKSGIEVLEYIRSSDHYRKTPAILFTSSLSPAERVRVDALGVSAFLLKSLDLIEYNRIGPAIKTALAQPDSSNR